MYLKEIEVNGFKSFADKLNIKLDDEVTCIVGPNGSGKSNVVDAVRWVLGEQSVKSLRGDGNMSDVIFSGSKSRNSSNVASVALIFDNSDNYLQIPFTEVSIKRRIYRTGENEYYLNGEKCRLKDITDLFMDSGIGKESFNIISQGEVQRILSNSSSERRVVFEEAASVLKYKKRKEEAIRKLERTNQNIERVDDIIGELETQIGPLKEQSRKAREYKDAKEKLENVEVALIAYEVNRMNEENIVNKKRITELDNELLTISNKNTTVEVELDIKKQSLNEKELEYQQENKKLMQITQEVERINGEKNILKERSKYDKENSKVHEQLMNKKDESIALKNQLFVQEKELEVLNINFKNISNNLKDKELEISSLSKKREDSYREYNEKSKDYLEIKNRITILENSIENGGGLPNSVKSILNNPTLSGVHNTIASLINADEKYTKALEVALMASKYYCVVDDETVAKKCINYLKEKNLGRATFYPLNVIKGKNIDYETSNQLNNQQGYIDILSNLVSYDEKYKNIITNQLGNVLVTNNIDNANQLSRKINNRYKIVTLDGDVINVGGSITGGSLNAGKSIITQKQELETLKNKKITLKSVILEVDSTLKQIEQNRSQLDSELFKIRQEYIKLDEQIKNKMQYMRNSQEKIDDVDKEIKSLELLTNDSLHDEEERLFKLYSEKVNEKNEIIYKLEKIKIEKEKISEEIEKINANNKLDNQNQKKLETEKQELEMKVNKYDMKMDYYLETLNEEYSMTFEKAKNNYQLEIEVEEAKEKVNLYKSIIKKIGMVNLDSIEEYEKVNERYTFLTSQKDDLINAKNSLYEIISEMDSVMKKEFVETFEKIRVEFREVFKKLFNGGEADLKLTDPENILETGVDIIASPPGKKLTTISLLSGGEKTLTAISLLFAILNIRQIPFCLFDEVEAALDEANVDNFGKYLDHYRNKTQFLLITHKKKTMEYAKTLYGITMQESGVSKLVSVKFDKINV